MADQPSPALRIFISYRRDDAGGSVRALLSPLKDHYGADRIFKDTDSIPFGEDFAKVIQKELNSCRVLLAVIGNRWTTIEDPRTKKRRIDNPTDYLRLEVTTALKNEHVVVIPVLVDRANMPSPDDLPSDLEPLARRNAIELSDTRWDTDVERLIRAIDGICAVPVALPQVEAEPAPSPASRPAPTLPTSGAFDVLEARRRRQVAEHVQAARDAFASQDYEAVLAACERAIWLQPSEAEALELAGKAQAAIDEQKIRGWLSEAQTALAAGNLAAASEAIDEALSRSPNHVEAVRLRQELLRARQERERQREVDRLVATMLSQARRSLDEEDFETATHHVEDALALAPESAEALDLHKRAVAVRDEFRQQRELKRRAQHAVNEANDQFAAGQRAEAISRLEEFTPEHELVTRALDDLRRRDAEQVAAEQRERREALEAAAAAEKARVEREAEAKRQEEARRAEEARLAAEAAKRAEDARREETRKAAEAAAAAEKARLVREAEAKRQEEARRAEKARLAAEAEKRAEGARREEARKAAEAAAAEKARLEREAEAKHQEESRRGEEARRAEAAKREEDVRREDARKAAEAAAAAEKTRLERESAAIREKATAEAHSAAGSADAATATPLDVSLSQPKSRAVPVAVAASILVLAGLGIWTATRPKPVSAPAADAGPAAVNGQPPSAPPQRREDASPKAPTPTGTNADTGPKPPAPAPPTSSDAPGKTAAARQLESFRAQARSERQAGRLEPSLTAVAAGLKLDPRDPALLGMLDAIANDAQAASDRAKRDARAAGATPSEPNFNQALQKETEAGKNRESNKEAAVRSFWAAAEGFTKSAAAARQTAADQTRQATEQARLAEQKRLADEEAARQKTADEARRRAADEESARQQREAAQRAQGQAPTQSDEEKITRLLDDYAAAYGRMDVDAITRIHPTVSAPQLKSTFSAARSYSMRITNPQMTVTGTTAVVVCDIAMSLRPHVGNAQNSNRRSTLRLQKTGDSWTIVDRR